LIFLLIALPSRAQNAIVNPSLDLSTLSVSEARAIFTMGQRLWPNGSRVSVFVLPDDNPEHKAFCKKTLGMFAHQLRQIWDRRVFSGTGQAPNTVYSAEEMIERVARTPGGIGYVQPYHLNKLDKIVRPITIRQ
jgi:ABC-type phosphate transport system substrate-binding protein